MQLTHIRETKTAKAFSPLPYQTPALSYQPSPSSPAGSTTATANDPHLVARKWRKDPIDIWILSVSLLLCAAWLATTAWLTRKSFHLPSNYFNGSPALRNGQPAFL